MDDRRDNDEAAGAPQLKLAKTEDAVRVRAGRDVDMDSLPPELAPCRLVDFPTMVPMENEFKGDRYFVRECYPEYYGLVMDMLSKRRGVAITGTPGIGKSVFMAYFFERFCAQHPNATIIMLSYDKKSVLKKVVVSRGTATMEQAIFDRARMEAIVGRHMEESIGKTMDEAIMLLDGPPKSIPEVLHWVSFSSPNEKWLGKIRKVGHALHKVYMPTWRLEELRDAANKLGREDLKQETSDDHLQLLEIDAGTEPTPRRPLIDVYFDVFGGVPRSCFAEGDLLLNEFEWLRSAIRNLTLEQVWKASNEQVASVEVAKLVHRAIHYEPEEEEVPVVLGYALPYQRSRLRVGSIWIKRWIFEREEEITKNHQDMLMNMLRAAPQAHSFLGFLYEAKVYQRLGIGCTIKAVRVGGQSQDNSVLKAGGQGEDQSELDQTELEVSISKTCSVGGITTNFTITAFDRTRSHLGIPYSKNLESIDGFYWHPSGDTVRVVLFQVTVAKRHPVKADGLIKVFQALNLWEAVRKDPRRAALVFVVPEDNVKHFIDTPQNVPAGIRADDTTPVAHLPGVARVRGGLLASCEIITVGQLRQCKTFADITRRPPEREIMKAKSAFSIAKKSLEKYESERCNGSAEEKLLQSIPQYVWGL